MNRRRKNELMKCGSCGFEPALGYLQAVKIVDQKTGIGVSMPVSYYGKPKPICAKCLDILKEFTENKLSVKLWKDPVEVKFEITQDQRGVMKCK